MRWTVDSTTPAAERMRQPVRLTVTSSSVTLRTPGAHLPTTMAGCAFLLVGVAMVLEYRPLDAWGALIGLSSAGLGTWLVMSSTQARLRLSVDGLELVGNARMRRFRAGIDEMDEFYIERTPHIVPWTSVWVCFRSGEQRAIEDVRVFGFAHGESQRQLQQAVDTLNAHLADMRKPRT